MVAWKRFSQACGYVEQNLLRITYLVKGDIRTLKIPAKCSSRRVDRLWEHTCFEAFIRADGDPSYYEFNFSPSGEWAAYSFRGYRDGGPIQDEGAGRRRLSFAARRIESSSMQSCDLDRLSMIRTGSTAADRFVGGDRSQRRHAFLLGVETSRGQARLSPPRFFRS